MRKMKDSGIEWIGEIPKEWEVLRNKNAFTCTKELVGEKSSETQLLSLTTKGVRKKDINNAEGKLPESFDTYQYVKTNDIIMCLFDLDCSAVFSGISFYDGMISPAYRVLTCTDRTFPKYAGYWFNYISYDRKFNHYAKNIRYTLSYEEFSTLPIIVPPYEEQQKISANLDTKCTKIDSIIEKQEKIIEKLKEYKLSVITEAVTKGLNPDVKMKDSGVEWIGEIPEEWGNRKLKTLVSIISKGTTPSTVGKDILNNGKVRFLKAENIQNNRIQFEPEFYIDEDTDEILKRSRLMKYDILYVIAGATIGKTAIIGNDVIPANTNQAVSFIRLNDVDNAKYIWYYLQSNYVKIILNQLSVQSAQPNLSMEDMGNFIICFPTEKERAAIVNYLDKKCSAIDLAIEKKQAIIEKLKEYKKSLIYEVVTGKKEVFSEEKAVAVICPVGIPTNEEEYAKILLMQKIITRCGKNLKGRTHLMKIFHALELELGFSFCSLYTRYIHGPYDSHIEEYENALVHKGWIKLKKGKNVEYIVVNPIAYKMDYNRIFAEYNKDIERIIDFFKQMKRTSKAEKVATLLASWNDFLIDGVAEPTDDMIINDVMNNWTDNKKNTSYETWLEILNQMRKAKIVPHGYGRHTIKMD